MMIDAAVLLALGAAFSYACADMTARYGLLHTTPFVGSTIGRVCSVLFLGAIVLIILEELLSSATVYWPLILGAILIAVVLFARGGLEGALAMLERRK